MPDVPPPPPRFPPPPPDTRPLAPATPAAPRLTPALPSEREPVLDALRGVAILGILLVNIHLMRGPDLWRQVTGQPAPPPDGADTIVAALTGWLASGKFVSSFAMLFGVGAAVIVGRARTAGVAPRPVLARRYLWLLVFGLAHMLLLFPGDILFIYGLTGLALLLFLDAAPRTVRWSATALISLPALATAGFAALGALLTEAAPADDPFSASLGTFAETRAEDALAAFTQGSYLDVVVANAWQALVLQGGQLVVIPWLLGLFLVGFGVGRAGWLADLRGHRPILRRIALLGIGLGLVLNLPLAAAGPLGFDGPLAERAVSDPALAAAIALAQLAGAPVLAAGYLAALTLLFLRVAPPGSLVAAGRMALTAYLLQSVLALAVFAGADLYGELGTASALWVVVGIWAAVLVVCPLWLRWFRMGPAEWVWRTLVYGRGQPIRQSTARR